MIAQLAETGLERLLALMMLFINLLPAGLAEPFQFPFMQRALLTAVLVGAICGVLSCVVILKRWSLLGDAISHAVLPGVATAYLLGWPLFIGALLTGGLTAAGIGLIERNSLLKEDAAMGIMFTGSFALGVVMISRTATSTHLMHVLFGNVLGVQLPQLMLTLLCSVLALGMVIIFYREIHLYSFDPVQASAAGMNTTILHYGLMLLLTLAIVSSLETVGIILVVAMLITPGATAYLLTNRLSSMMLIAAATGVFAAVTGLYVSFMYNFASGGSIVLSATCIFMIALLLAPKHGVIWRVLR